MSKVQYLNDNTFKTEAVDSAQPVLVDFYADWCGPCKMIGPVIEELADEFDGVARITKVDVDANPQTAGEFGVQSIPTILLFKGGEIVERWVGVTPKDVLADAIRSHGETTAGTTH